MHNYARREALKEYVERTKEILELSSPQLEGIDSAEDYRVHLQTSFQKIGELAHLNNEILREHFFPMVQEGHTPSGDDIEAMHAFRELLIDTTSMENLDLPLIYLQSKFILERAEKGGDIRREIFALDGMVIAAYMMLNLTIRLYPELDSCFTYRDEGLRAARRLLEFLEPEKFRALPDDECRELVLINSRYMRCLFEWDDKEDKSEVNAEDIRLMKQALALAEDPFYRESMPDYRWDAHIFRTLQYLADFTEYHNIHGFSQDQLCEIYDYTLQLVDFLKEHPELEDGCPEPEQQFYLLRNGYLAGKTTHEEHKAGLLSLMRQRDPEDFSARGMFISFIVPFEFILTLDRDHVSTEEQNSLRLIYEGIASYAYRMPKTGVLSFMLTFIADLLKNYIEVPGGITFPDMCLKLMAAMHPPTYVHTMNVADLTRVLTERLIEREPELFIGIEGAATAAEVRAKREEILAFAYRAALMHDIGKLFIVETIMTYGRTLLDSEWEIIRAHTIVGAALLARFEKTRECAEIACGHHRWYDGAGGYPESMDPDKAKYRTIIAVVEAADCLDAATDSIGRSYKKGKTLDEYIDEYLEGSGTRYAPFIAALLQDEKTREQLQVMLTEGRNENYRKTYRVLKEL